MPVSITAQVMPSPEAVNELRAASTLTVRIERLMQVRNSKSGQMRWMVRKRDTSAGGAALIAASAALPLRPTAWMPVASFVRSAFLAIFPASRWSISTSFLITLPSSRAKTCWLLTSVL